MSSKICFAFVLIAENRDTFGLPMGEMDFDYWVKYTQDTDSYHTVNAVTVVLMALRILLELTSQFPAFGVLFFTLARAKFELFNFFLVIF